MSSNQKQINKIIYFLLFFLLASFLVHNFDSIGQDIGRHLKVGEIIWQTKEIPKTNFFSFTESDFPFINHHWLSEVIFYGVFNLGGFTGLILLKVFTVIIAFSLLFFSVTSLWTTDLRSRLSTGFWPVVVSFLLFIFIFISRTEVRPEIFSFLILSFYLFVLFKAKYQQNYRYFWYLPLVQLFWVNLHIYFFIGPLIFAFFLIDQFKIHNSKFLIRKLFSVGSLIILVNLINPAGVQGAFLPFNVLKEYGYSIAENQTLAFLADFFGFNLPIFVFKLSVAVLAVSFLLTIKNLKNRIFEILVSAFFAYAGFKMLRNLPLYALASFPVMAILLADVFHKKPITNNPKPITSKIFQTAITIFLIFMTFFVVSGGYYKKANLSKTFGFSVPNGLERGIYFVKNNEIRGPIFNNFDIGGYLIWKLPEEKVFVDNRPEAYSVEFFSEIYKPMQSDKGKWKEFSEKYNINLVFFDHTDATPWGQAFISNITKDSAWRTVYINEDVIILVKNQEKNKKIISNLVISESNVIEKIVENIRNSNTNQAQNNFVLSQLLYNIGWIKATIYFADESVKLDSQNPYPYLYKGLAYANNTDDANQKLAAENIKKAIELGLKESEYYYILGVVYMNLGKFNEAERLFKEALKLDKNNTQAREFLEKYFE